MRHIKTIAGTVLLSLLSRDELTFAAPESKPILDVRFNAPYRQIESSYGDQWAPTWGRDDALYTGNDDGSSFGGVPLNTMSFGKLTGDAPEAFAGHTINGMLEFKERDFRPEAAYWNDLDSYKVENTFYRFVPCSDQEPTSTCLEHSTNGARWDARQRMFKGMRFRLPRFVVWGRQFEISLKPGEYLYLASYAGVIDGEDQYFIARAPLTKLASLSPDDWSFWQADGSWGSLESATTLGRAGWNGPDRANWKMMNTYSVDGVLYSFITRCIYPHDSDDPRRRHIWFNSSIIKSTDEGKTWARTAQENYDHPMFPGRRFGAPYFVWYGKDGKANVDNADRYVYAISNNGFFENGDDFVIGRVLRSKLANLSAADWSFYVGGDGLKDGSWSRLQNAQPILTNTGKSSMTGMTYIEALQRYVLVSWHYTQENFESAIKAKDLSTSLEFFDAPNPWGPWSKFKTLYTGRLGWYTPIIGQRFQSKPRNGAVEAVLYATGFYTKPEGGLDAKLYKLNYIPITLSTKRLEHKYSEYTGGEVR